MKPRIRPVILCGGSGTRLWPLSRRLEPKQFQALVGDRSMFLETLSRFNDGNFGRALILVNAIQEPRVRYELEQVTHVAGMPTVMVEPAMRSTAPAIAAAAVAIAAEDPDAIMLVVPSDHRIGRPDNLLAGYRAALGFVEAGGIALFGIRPTAPETGFGYIRAGLPLTDGVCKVDRFIEKPNLERAMELIAEDCNTWNSGIFMFRARTILEELAAFAPDVLAAAERSVEEAIRPIGSLHLSESFTQAPEISIDHAVMERSTRLGVVPVSPDWSDLGSFEALWEAGCRNGEDNVIVGDVLLKDVSSSYINTGRRLVSVVGLSNIVVVDTEDALLIASRSQSQDVKFIAQHLVQTHHPAADRHVLRRQRGGIRHEIDRGEDYLIERVTVLPGQTMDVDLEPGLRDGVATVLSGEAVVVCNAGEVRLGSGRTVDITASSRLVLVNEGNSTAHLLLGLTLFPAASPAVFGPEQRKVV